MVVRTAQQRHAVGPRVPFKPQLSGSQKRGKARILAVSAVACLLSACDVPVPDSALLKPLPAPKCEQRASAKGDAKATDAKAGDDAEAVRTKLDYERQCYRHAELIARGKMRNLQEQVAKTMLALKAQRNGQVHQTVGP